MIKLHAVTYSYGQQRVFSATELTIEKGGIIAIIGPNGAGKSTLLKLIARQLPLQNGQIAVDDLDIAATPPSTLARTLTLVAQNLDVVSRVRVRDLISFGRWPHSKGRLDTSDNKAIDAAITAFDLNDLQSRFLDQLSGGQKQCAFLAMAYAQQTDWMLLDEPLNNLDIKHAQILMQRLRALADERARTIVMVVHDINYALGWADRCIAMKGGEVSFMGATKDVLTAQSASDLFETSVQLGTIDGQPVFKQHN